MLASSSKMSLDECRVLCKRVKYVASVAEWAERPNHSGALRATSDLLDENRVAISGLYFHGEYQSRRWGTYCSFALMINRGGTIRRVFMVEVYPTHVRSHLAPDGSAIFGPHIAIGDEREISQISREGLNKSLPA